MVKQHTVDVGLYSVGLEGSLTVHIVARFDTFFFRPQNDNDAKAHQPAP